MSEQKGLPEHSFPERSSIFSFHSAHTEIAFIEKSEQIGDPVGARIDQPFEFLPDPLLIGWLPWEAITDPQKAGKHAFPEAVRTAADERNAMVVEFQFMGVVQRVVAFLSWDVWKPIPIVEGTIHLVGTSPLTWPGRWKPP